MELKDVEKLAELARIEMSSEEKANMLKDFKSILGYVDQIQSVDLSTNSSVEKLDKINIFREDVLSTSDSQEDKDPINTFVSIAPQKQDGYIKVKKILS
ncbi:hypothetical protein A3I25_02075 [Candidatus Nomurabacteria bacterium RIFCSPLOWO2_02_FULL_42_17]|uniref:Asp/Glu-ADT subunit C n=2 Tax=Candidatus Nomuraibacteriota TaxID=1752729 RepID=A0A1F6WLW0_9BACT|nr:MAG: Glutamyl-tRNA(Gln) amidotransferase subunit C 1 [Parcubacteria group bacterium GW2011_GWA2_42_18]OGI82867.1 MAG: hypothetical protein A3B93_02225 [Candidatus Nomurabacteria bacterium RIFCSPHIGHO2_02_FULL_42_24]OGI97099.1 MAG: hypothetical protein A3I25_02075 [Candidatus Nomurabacteria bacterium RIFCSPLOWO2_02_FULL_42_17]